MIKIMLIDDDQDDRELFREAILEVDPFIDCHLEGEAITALESLTKFSSGLPDILFLDINLPVVSGWDCLVLLREDPKYDSIAVIMYSTASQSRDKEKAQLFGAMGLLSKPLSFDDLKFQLNVILGHLRSKTLSAGIVSSLEG